MADRSNYLLGWDDGYAEGYAVKLEDVTELFMPPAGTANVEAAARYLMSKRADLSLPDAIGLARGAIKAASEVKAHG